MTDAPKSPKRRRRKVIVAFAALVFMSMVAWWYWPRGDARFVGKWDLMRYEDDMYAGSVPAIEFRRNGSAALSVDGGMDSFPFRWSAGPTRIRFGHRKLFALEQLNKLHSQIMRWLYGATDPWLEEAEYEIIECTEERVVLHQPGTRIRVELDRFDATQHPPVLRVDWDGLTNKARSSRPKLTRIPE